MIEPMPSSNLFHNYTIAPQDIEHHLSNPDVIEANGITYVHSTNFDTRAGAERYAKLGDFQSVNRLTVIHVMAEAGLVIVSENHGLAKDMYGKELNLRCNMMALKRDPDIGRLGWAGIDAEIHRNLGGEARNELSNSIPPPNDRRVDIRDARAALETVLKDPQFVDAANIARQHREQVFGKNR